MEKQRDRLPQTRAKGEDEMNNTIKTLQHKENKLAGEGACRGSTTVPTTLMPMSVLTLG